MLRSEGRTKGSCIECSFYERAVIPCNDCLHTKASDMWTPIGVARVKRERP